MIASVQPSMDASSNSSARRRCCLGVGIGARPTHRSAAWHQLSLEPRPAAPHSGPGLATMRRGTARHERSNLSKKSSGLLPEAEEAARIDQRIARYLADLDATERD